LDRRILSSMTDIFERTFNKPVNAEYRRQHLEQQRRYFEAIAGVPLEIDEVVTGPRGELTVRWRPYVRPASSKLPKRNS
jgi:hypothetical protein